MSAASSFIRHFDEFPAVPFPERTDVRWETTDLLVWNGRESGAKQEELIYEVSWIKELGTWRRFLTSRRTVLNGCKCNDQQREQNT